EPNKSGLKGNVSHLVVTDRKTFGKTFISPFIPDKKAKLVLKDAFGKKFVVAVITRGNTTFEYSAVKPTSAGATLKVTYNVTTLGDAGSARSATPLVVSVDKGKCKMVVVNENGKDVAKVSVK